MKNPFRILTPEERIQITIQDKRDELIQVEFNLSRARAAVTSARANLAIANQAGLALVPVGRPIREPDDSASNRAFPNSVWGIRPLPTIPDADFLPPGASGKTLP